MKTTKLLTISVLALGAIAFMASSAEATPMGTAFTYQGQLIDANVPGDGVFEFQFELYDSPEDGNQLDGTVALRGVDVIDGYFTVELDFGGAVFDGDACWLEIGLRPSGTTNPFTILTPRQELTPTPYALYAANTSADDDWMVLGDNMYSIPLGNVGIGTSSPSARLSIQMKGNPISPSDVGGLIIKDAMYNSGNQLDIQDCLGNTNFLVDHVGRVGIGTNSPEAALHVKGTGWPNSFVYLQSDLGEDTGIRLYEGNNVKWHIFNMSEIGGLRICNSDFSKDVFFAKQSNGKVGIGTTNPTAVLDVLSRGTNEDVITAHASDGSKLFNVEETGTGDGLVSVMDNAGDMKIFLNSRNLFGSFISSPLYVGAAEFPPIGPGLTVKGNILVRSKSTGMNVLELGEGLDYAEGFDVTEDADIEPGTVLVIDCDNPGKLTVSRSAYDSKVAGIVAGANGIGSGVRLGVGQFDHDVALAGRVYCKVDATQAAVLAGDLLTTSDTAGYAMKATDYDRARGAVLGKAMQKLQLGHKGQILVLVTLQ
jgi:hypothetical protein